MIPSSTTTTGTTGTTTTATTYTVKSGDTLWGISQTTGVSISNLEQANPNINPNDLSVGTVLVIPASTTGSNSGTTTSTPTTGTASSTPSVSSVAITTSSTGAYNNAVTQVNTAVPVSVTVEDAQGNSITVPQSQITYTITGTNEVSNPANASINSSTQEFTATQPGSYACVATVNGVQSQPLDIDVIGPVTQLDVSTPPNLVTGSNTLVPVTFDVSDAVGQPPDLATPITITVSNPSVAGISLTNGGPLTSLPSAVKTTIEGIGGGKFWIRAGSTAGTANLTVTCGALTKTVPIQSITGPTKVVTTVSSPTVVANTNFSDTITVQAYNEDGSPAANVPLSTEYSTGLFKVLNSTVTTDIQGVAQYTVYENSTSTGNGVVGVRTSQAADDAPSPLYLA